MMKSYGGKLLAGALVAAISYTDATLATEADWSNACTGGMHGNSTNTREPTLTWDTTTNQPGVCAGYDGTIDAISPCNNSKMFATQNGTNIIVPNGEYVDIPLAQFNNPADTNPDDDITQAKMVCVHVYAALQNVPAGSLLEVWYRANGTTWDTTQPRSSSSNFPWDGMDFVCVPVRNQMFEYKVQLYVPAGLGSLTSQPVWQLNYILLMWCK